RVAVWGIAATLLTLATGLTLFVFPARGYFLAPTFSAALLVGFLIVDAIVVGLFFGQVVVRTITAWVLACLMFALTALPQAGLAQITMIPSWSLALFPALVLGISWAWAGDWMQDLRGPARWLRLGVMVVAAGVVLVALYIPYRAWSVPDIGPPPELI